MKNYVFAGGVRGGYPPEAEINVVENGLISKRSIFSNKISKTIIKLNFSIQFSSKIFKIFSKYRKNLCFLSKLR